MKEEVWNLSLKVVYPRTGGAGEEEGTLVFIKPSLNFPQGEEVIRRDPSVSEWIQVFYSRAGFFRSVINFFI